MKIIVPILGSFGNAGGWRVLSQLANFWIKAGNEVVFLVFINSPKPYFPTNAKIVYYDISGKLFDTGQNFKNPILGVLLIRVALKKALDKIEGDIVFANHSLTAWCVYKSKIIARKFYYVQAYEPDYYLSGFKNRIFRYLSKKSYSYNLEIIVNSEMFFDYKEIKSNKCVYPGLDLKVFKPEYQVKVDEKIIIGTIGRIEEYKGTTYILDAFKLLRKELGEKVELHIAFGDKSIIIDGVKMINIEGDVQLAAYYNSLSVYVCAMYLHLDAVHYPVIEAMACKIPVVTTGYKPANNANACIVPIKDALSIKESIKKIFDNKFEVLEKTEQGYADIQIFDWEKVSNKMLAYFN